MKKQFLVSVIITLFGICFWFLGNNSIKACITNTKCFSTKIENRIRIKSVKEKVDKYFSSAHFNYEKDTKMLLMDPLIQMQAN